jgi:hypothetical protein
MNMPILCTAIDFMCTVNDRLVCGYVVDNPSKHRAPETLDARAKVSIEALTAGTVEHQANASTSLASSVPCCFQSHRTARNRRYSATQFDLQMHWAKPSWYTQPLPRSKVSICLLN